MKHFLVTTPKVRFTFIGTAEPDGGHVWLCGPDGRRLFRVPQDAVRECTPEETAQRIVQDRRAACAGRN
jgi:hypothetical protein